MPDGLFSSWGKPVPGLFMFSGISAGLYPIASRTMYTVVGTKPGFYRFILGFLHDFKTLFISNKLVFLHIVHTPYNKRLVYLNIVINSRRLA